MSFADVVYFTSLILCITLGTCYKKINDAELKRNYGAGLGLLLTLVICGHYTIHSVLMVWGNIIIIKCCDRKYVHHLSLTFTWLHLGYMSINLDTTHYVLWLHQTIALRLVGLAFEIHTAEKISALHSPSSEQLNAPVKRKVSKSKKKISSKVYIGDSNAIREPNAIDIIAYAYYFIGLHKGPYYRWKIFNEHFLTPFGALGDCRIITEQKLKKACLCAVFYVLLRMKFPVQIYYDNEFYTNHGTDFRYLYNIPQLIVYILQYQVVMLLCTSVCTEAGFGVYPTKTQPVPGHGPSTKFSFLNLAAVTEEVALEQEYNFAMLRSFENEKLLIGPRMRDTLRGWDMSTRYWFWAHTYKGLIKSNKEVRSALSFLAWTMWCGPTLQQLIISSTLWVHLHLESEYGDLYETNVSMKMPWDIGFSIMRMFCLIYLTPCLILRDSSTVLRYYNSIFWIYHIVLFFLILGALGISKVRLTRRQYDIA